MATFLLIRHTEHELGVHCIAGRNPGVSLSGAGRDAARSLAKRLAALPIAAIYSSPMDRARQTAEPIAAAHHLDISIAEELDEVEFGEWSGLTLGELAGDPRWQHWNAFRSTAAPPGGEHMLSVQSRMISLLMRLDQQHGNELVALVSHGDTIRATLAAVAAIPLDLFLRIEVSLGSISTVRLPPRQPAILCVNNLEGVLPIA